MRETPRLNELDRYSEEHREELRRLQEAAGAIPISNPRSGLHVNRNGSVYMQGDFELLELIQLVKVLSE